MFDLEKAIADWRKQMLAAGIRAPLPLEELENHLREEIEHRRKTGLEVQHAFEISAEHVGKARALNSEFKKIGASSMAEKSMIAVCAMFVGFITLLGTATVVLCYTKWSDRATASAAMISSLVVACRWRYIVPFLPVIADARKRLAVSLAVIACGFAVPPFICDVVLPRGIGGFLPPTVLWTFLLLTVLFCAGVGLAMSEHEREKWGIKRLN